MTKVVPDHLRTERLELRLFAPGDETALVRQLAQREVAQQLTHVPYPYRLTDARAWIDDCLAHPPGRKNGCRFAIAQRSDGALVGGISVLPHVLGHELGYWLGRSHWRNGFASEAATAVVGYAVHELGIRRFVAYVFDGNDASMNVLRKLAFDRVGVETVKRPAGDSQVVHRYLRLVPR
jgi:RimJ/RimL family protein N-acetyltransferase